MKKVYFLLLALIASAAMAQKTISFEENESYTLGSLHNQNKWEVTEGSNGIIKNQTITNSVASHGVYSFKNAYETDFKEQWLPIFGAAYTFDSPENNSNLSISYDVMVTGKGGSDFEFTLYTIKNGEYSPVAGVGIENRGFIYLIKDENYGFNYANAQWEPNTWINVKIEITHLDIKYYINNSLDQTVQNFSHNDVFGFNMLHNNYGADGYYDNIKISSLSVGIDRQESDSIHVYPNPVKDKLRIESTVNQYYNVEIYDMNGLMILKSKNLQYIDMNHLPPATYVIKLTDQQGRITNRKIIKK